MRTLATLAVLTLAGTAVGQVTVYSTDFDSATLGDLDDIGTTIGTGIWTGFATGPSANLPAIDVRNGSQQLVMSVNNNTQGGERSSSRALLTFANPIDTANYTSLTFSFDLSQTAGVNGSGADQRHNLYWDFGTPGDGTATDTSFGPRQFFPDGQFTNDGGDVQLLRDNAGAFSDNSRINIGRGGFVDVNVRYEFDLVNGTVSTFWGASQVDNNIVFDADLFPGGLWSEFVFDFAKDFRQAPEGAETWVDHFSVTGSLVPTPGALGVFAAGGALALRRRR